MDQAAVRDETELAATALAAAFARSRCWRLYQAPTCASRMMAASAARPNHAMLVLPFGRMIHAASRGPMAAPPLPPTWKMDCARPCRPPDANRAMREDSGWNTAEPTPMRAAAASTPA